LKQKSEIKSSGFAVISRGISKSSVCLFNDRNLISCFRNWWLENTCVYCLWRL